MTFLLLVKRKPGIEEIAVIKESWLLERPKGWEAVVSKAKVEIAKSTIVPPEVKKYYQKSKLTAQVSRIKKCVEKLHVLPSKNDNAATSNSSLSAASSAEPPTVVPQPNKEQNAKEYALEEPEKRRERNKKRKRAKVSKSSDESSSNEYPKKGKGELQKEALHKHSKMCDAALATE